jgi:N-acyl-D-amino-acid deacylase
VLDVILRGGTVIDGTGSPPRIADIGVRDGRIAGIARRISEPSAEVIDASGLAVTPGFIDMHVHADLRLLADPSWSCGVAQGMTTLVLGQDGLGVAPCTEQSAKVLAARLVSWNGEIDEGDWTWRSVAGYLRVLQRARPAPNIAAMVPHGSIRLMVMGDADLEPTKDQLDSMRAAVAAGMREGAFGLTTGLTYAPGMYATDDEIVALAGPVRLYNGYYQPHQRDYGARAIAAYRDSIGIGRRAGVPVQLTHAALNFPVNRDRAGELLDLVDEANAAGQDVSMDAYPYLAGSTSLHAFFPSWTHREGADGFLRVLADAEARPRIRHELEVTGSDGLGHVPIDWSKIVIANVTSEAMAWCVGRTLPEAARMTPGGSAPFDFACDLLASEGLSVLCIAHVGNEENLNRIIAHPATMACSDGLVAGAHPHPRAWGTFARYLGHYVRTIGLLPLEEMVRKMTSAPARRLGLSDRGTLAPGLAADIAVIDPATVADRATYSDPRLPPAGVPHVIVNGVVVKRDDQMLDARPGRVLRKPRTGIKAGASGGPWR